MTSPPIVCTTLSDDQRKLQTFLLWVFALVGSYALLDAIIAYLVRDHAFGVCALVLGCFTGLIGVALNRIRYGDVPLALALFSGGLLASAILVALFVPAVVPAMASMPLIVVAAVLPYYRGRLLLQVIGGCFLVTVGITVIGLLVPSVSRVPTWIIIVYQLTTVPAVTFVVLLLLWQFSSRLGETLAQTRRANEHLQATQAELEGQISARVAAHDALQRAMTEVQMHAAEQARLLTENEAQRSTILQLSLPVLPVNDRTIVMPVIGLLDARRLADLQEHALQAIERSSRRSLLLDFSGVPLMDRQIAEGILRLVQAARLLGTQVVLVGVHPRLAESMVAVGMDLQHVQTALDLQTAIHRFG